MPAISEVLINAKDIKVLESPAQFHQEVLNGIQEARKYCYISSLYIGSEQEEILRLLIQKAIRHGVQITTITDYTRSFRSAESSNKSHSYVRTFQTLWNENCSQLKIGDSPVRFPSIALFRLPGQVRPLRWLLPLKWQEVFGVFHSKFYLFDDKVILTGANLSESYLTKRYDRWIVLRNEELSALLRSLADLWVKGSHTLHLTPRPTAAMRINKPTETIDDVMRKTAQTLHGSKCNDSSKLDDSVIVLKVAVNYHNTLERSTKDSENRMVIDALAGDGARHITIATPYMNMSRQMLQNLRNRLRSLPTDSSIHWITAAPNTFGFKSAPNILRFIPDVYHHLSSHAYNKFSRLTRNRHILSKLFLLHPNNQLNNQLLNIIDSFHSKGIWNFHSTHHHAHGDEDGDEDVRVLFGSSNFSKRSQFKDLELLFGFHSKHPPLTRVMAQELHNMHRFAQEEQQTHPYRQHSFLIKLFSLLFRSFL